MKKQIILYTSKGCTRCRTLKRWLKRNKIPFTEKDLSNTDVLAGLVMRNLVVLSAPILKIKNKFFLPHEIFREDDSLNPAFKEVILEEIKK